MWSVVRSAMVVYIGNRFQSIAGPARSRGSNKEAIGTGYGCSMFRRVCQTYGRRCVRKLQTFEIACCGKEYFFIWLKMLYNCRNLFQVTDEVESTSLDEKNVPPPSTATGNNGGTAFMVVGFSSALWKDTMRYGRSSTYDPVIPESIAAIVKPSSKTLFKKVLGDNEDFLQDEYCSDFRRCFRRLR